MKHSYIKSQIINSKLSLEIRKSMTTLSILIGRLFVQKRITIVPVFTFPKAIKILGLAKQDLKNKCGDRPTDAINRHRLPGNFKQIALLVFVLFTVIGKNIFCQVDPGADKYFRTILHRVRDEFKVPALGGVLVVDGKVVVAGSFGVRKEGTANYVTDNDKFPIGSVSKTFTGFVAARLTQPNNFLLSPITWSTKIRDVFPQLATTPGIQQGYLDKTVAHLTTHLADLPNTPIETTVCDKTNFNSYMVCGRNEHMVNNLKQTPVPGTMYSNIGPVIVANMCQRRTGRIWEDLVREYIYTPLNISASFISSINPNNIIVDPQFHNEVGLINQHVPYNDWDKYNIAAPSGHVTISPKDMGKYLIELMPGAADRVGALNQTVLNQYLGQYDPSRPYTRGGWGIEANTGTSYSNWAPGKKILAHDGSHLKNYTVAKLLPDAKVAFCSMTNSSCDPKVCSDSRGANAVSKLNNHFAHMWFNYNVLPFFDDSSPFSITGSKINVLDNSFLKMQDMDMLTFWKAGALGSSFRITINSNFTTVKGLMLVYPRLLDYTTRHNIKTIRIFATNTFSGEEMLVYTENQVGKDHSIFEFEPAISTNKLRLEFDNISNKTTEIAEVLLVYNDPLSRMNEKLMNLTAIDKRVIQPPPVLRSGPSVSPVTKVPSAENNDFKIGINSNPETISSGALDIARLEQNKPNPFNSLTTIGYMIPRQFTLAKIIITDKTGRIIKKLNITAGKGSLNLDASVLAAGAYNYSLYVDGRIIDTKQMILTK